MLIISLIAVVSIYFNKENIEYIVLRPEAPVHWRSHFCFLFLFSVILLLLAVIFAIHGLWVILPFAGIEVIALLALSYHVTCKRFCQEVIHVTDKHVSFGAGRHFPVHEWCCHRLYCQLQIHTAAQRSYNDKIMLCCDSSEVEVGRFLNNRERQDLIHQLRLVLEHA